MTDKADPRLGVARDLFDASPVPSAHAALLLARLDAADRAAGIVRVDTGDEALVERLLEVAAEPIRAGCAIPTCRSNHHADAWLVLRAVLAALREVAQ